MSIESQARTSSERTRHQIEPAIAPAAPGGWPPGRFPAWAVRHSVLLACGCTILLHLPFLSTNLDSDEGGFALVARLWTSPGHYLYGPLWVDRPPGLIAVFAVADQLGPYGVRLMTTVMATLLVAMVALAARTVGGGGAARWSAWTACALVSSTFLGGYELNGELVAATAVAASVAASLAARRGRSGCVVVAGLLATCALLCKQNFADALAFGVVLILLDALRTRGWRRGLRRGAGFAVGAAVPVALAGVWAGAHGGVNALLYATYGFRVDASRVMASWSFAAPEHRLWRLVIFAVLSGMVSILVLLMVAHRARLRRLDPIGWAIAAGLFVELLGIAGGGNFWVHYLIGPVPMLALGIGLSTRPSWALWRLARGVVVLAVATTLVAVPITAGARTHGSAGQYVADWLRASARPGDSVVIPYTHPNVIEMSGLLPAYPYAWSLPLRTLDPHLDLLVRTLEGPQAPTWVVRWDHAHTWGLDPADRVQHALEQHYHQVADLCGHSVWLHDLAVRTPAPTPSGGSCS